jgi:peptide/nickel transport system permease protein
MITKSEAPATGRANLNPLRAVRGVVGHPRVSPSLIIGGILVFSVLAVSLVLPHLVDQKQAVVGALPPDLHPSSANWFGTDAQGRSVFVFVAIGTWQTLKIGLIAGAVGLTIGLFFGLLSGYLGGAVDGGTRVLVDSLMTIPQIAILVLVASNIGQMTVNTLALVVALLAWMIPARTIRAQMLTMRERGYVELARANGQRDPEIVLFEILPNLIPYIAASFVAAVGAGILAAIGLEALGLGVSSVPTLGTTIYWAQKYSAVLTGEWWWWVPPIAIIAVIFISLFMLSAGLDRLANPRVRARV